jgi:hypothetical protein
MEYDTSAPPSDNEITHQLLRTIAEQQLHTAALLRSTSWPLFIIVLLLAYIAYKLHG